jgi:hypothetical protein
MDSIDTFSSKACIIRTILTFSPHGPSTFTKSELVDSFSEAVSSLSWELKIHLDVLVHQDKGRAVGMNIHVALVPHISEGE